MEAPHYPGKRLPAPASATALLLVLALLAGCGGTPEIVRRPAPARIALPAAWPAVAPEQPDAANAVLMRALSLVGTPYRYGGNTPESGFDCSGLIGYVFGDMLSRALPRNSGELARIGAGIGPERMATGDLVVFGDASAVSHVGIYVGEGRFVHAPSSGGTVRLDRVDGPYWRERFRGARRLLR
ncbi:MAG TPA: C40 family peptidase [Lysobacter sp.]